MYVLTVCAWKRRCDESKYQLLSFEHLYFSDQIYDFGVIHNWKSKLVVCSIIQQLTEIFVYLSRKQFLMNLLFLMAADVTLKVVLLAMRFGFSVSNLLT